MAVDIRGLTLFSLPLTGRVATFAIANGAGWGDVVTSTLFAFASLGKLPSPPKSDLSDFGNSNHNSDKSELCRGGRE